MAKASSKKASKKTQDEELPLADIVSSSIIDEAQKRYLQYALSVITSRALPDVRDGLKPVQRRILYAMQHELHLSPDAKPRKCALVVGDVMGKFHPHGDTAIYDALARLAQDFVMRERLVDGRGNFGSPDGDAPAAMRYTECRLAPLAIELLSELGKKTVAFRPNYDGTRFEPVVLPARYPNLLVNGSQGIAVGMATSIPPHNLGEVIQACVALIDDPELTVSKLGKFVKGPDFPTGGQLLSSRKEMERVYQDGQGSLKLRGDWTVEERKSAAPLIVIDAIPYNVERRMIVEQIAQIIIQKKLTNLVDVRDESTEKCRIVLEVKKEADPALVMAYVYKHTSMQVSVHVNLTCLVPTQNADIAAPRRLGLKEVLRQFLDFRFETVTKRLEHELGELRSRIHLLEGFEKIFPILDEVIRIIRKSEDRNDAAKNLMKRFGLDEEQVQAILELRLYRLARLEIDLIQKELKDKRAEAKRLEGLLKSPKSRWGLIKDELLALAEARPSKRLTKISEKVEEPEYEAEAFIVDEDNVVILTQQGWIKRQKAIKDVGSTRMREGDRVLSAVVGSTKCSVAAFSNQGVCYVTRLVDVPASTGHGSPVQTLFKLKDGERIVGLMSFDPRVLNVPPPTEGTQEAEPPLAIGVSKQGMATRFSLRPHRDPSTRAGRKYMRLKEGDEVLSVAVTQFKDVIACVSAQGHALLCLATEVPVLSGPGRGVTLIKLKGDDTVFAAGVLSKTSEPIRVKSEGGKTFEISPKTREITARGGKGIALFKRGALQEWVWPEPVLVDLGSKES